MHLWCFLVIQKYSWHSMGVGRSMIDCNHEVFICTRQALACTAKRPYNSVVFFFLRNVNKFILLIAMHLEIAAKEVHLL